jgi:hypothetical protein
MTDLIHADSSRPVFHCSRSRWQVSISQVTLSNCYRMQYTVTFVPQVTIVVEAQYILEVAVQGPDEFRPTLYKYSNRRVKMKRNVLRLAVSRPACLSVRHPSGAPG